MPGPPGQPSPRIISGGNYPGPSYVSETNIVNNNITYMGGTPRGLPGRNDPTGGPGGGNPPAPSGYKYSPEGKLIREGGYHDSLISGGGPSPPGPPGPPGQGIHYTGQPSTPRVQPWNPQPSNPALPSYLPGQPSYPPGQPSYPPAQPSNPAGPPIVYAGGPSINHPSPLPHEDYHLNVQNHTTMQNVYQNYHVDNPPLQVPNGTTQHPQFAQYNMQYDYRPQPGPPPVHVPPHPHPQTVDLSYLYASGPPPQPVPTPRPQEVHYAQPPPEPQIQYVPQPAPEPQIQYVYVDRPVEVPVYIDRPVEVPVPEHHHHHHHHNQTVPTESKVIRVKQSEVPKITKADEHDFPYHDPDPHIGCEFKPPEAHLESDAEFYEHFSWR